SITVASNSSTQLQTKRDQLQTIYNDLTEERDQLQTSYNNLTEDRDQLQTSYNNLTEERDQLQTIYNDLTEERDQLQIRWFYFSDSVYYISSTKKTWQDSRNDCLWRGADLVIINSRQEQDFLRQHQKEMWIGLTDRQWEGVWKWVDGSPLTTSFWYSGEPNSHRGNEDCVEINSINIVYNWNDETCENENFWICEKKMIS
uniref:C-type lectin domain-containing protein n=1 Tax=Sparus aurata TaxID=8175 RepID=A0A671TKR5_SPAAU